MRGEVMKNNGFPNDLCKTEHGSIVKVIHPDGRVTYQEATYWPNVSRALPGKKGKKVRNGT